MRSTEMTPTETTAALARLMPRVLVTLIVVALALVAPATVASAEEDIDRRNENEAVAVNTEDGASVFRLAFSIAHVADGTVDQENLALAYASCTDCQTVALAFQVVFVVGGANSVTPMNQAIAINDQCAECLTFASATQIIIGVDEPVVFTPEGRRRLIELQKRMKLLEVKLPNLTAAQLAAEVSSIERELLAILDEEVVPVSEVRNRQDADGSSTTTTTTTTTPDGTTTTTAPTTTEPPSVTTTSPPDTTVPTTEPPATSVPAA